MALLGPDGTEPPGPHTPFTKRAKKALDVAIREALRFGHNYIGTEHLLLGLLAEGSEKDHGLARQALTEVGVTYQPARDEIVRLIAEYGESRVAAQNAD